MALTEIPAGPPAAICRSAAALISARICVRKRSRGVAVAGAGWASASAGT